MAAVVALILFGSITLAANNSTTTEGWQLDNDNSRSSWDIVWSCLSTILACTWTVLHVNVPRRRKSSFRVKCLKVWQWFLTLMAPELVAWTAAQQLWQARSTAVSCNKKQAAKDEATHEPMSQLQQRSVPLVVAQAGGQRRPDQDHSKWTLAQCFCLVSQGIAIQTEDEWIYTIRPREIEILIDAGIVRCSEIRERDIEDRAKADSFAKAFTVLQSLWTTVNILARAFYKLPISLIELVTVSYVLCGLFTYACWWHKAKDMTSPIIVYAPFTRANLPPEVKAVVEADEVNWVYLRVVIPEENITDSLRLVREWYSRLFLSNQSRRSMIEGARQLTILEEAALDAFAILIGLAFIGLHLAAWNSQFATKTEKIAWRVFALVCTAAAVIVYLVGQLPVVSHWFRQRGLLPYVLDDLGNLEKPQNKLEIIVSLMASIMYILARFGLLALTLAALRALPAGSYKAIDWLDAIPHI